MIERRAVAEKTTRRRTPGSIRSPQKYGDLSDMYTKAAPTKREVVANMRRKKGFLRRGCPKSYRGSLVPFKPSSLPVRYAWLTIVDIEGRRHTGAGELMLAQRRAM